MKDTNEEEVRAAACTACGTPIGEEEWLFDDRSIWPDEQDSAEAYIHESCAG